MPTLQVTPDAPDLLQNVADTLAKSRKMVIITGAGISTNSGIPDFRSENGLYSLIQDQFERAESNANANIKRDSEEDHESAPPSPPATATAVSIATIVSPDMCQRPLKRRRTSGPDKTASLTSSLPESPISSDRPGQSAIRRESSTATDLIPCLAQRDLTQERNIAVVPSDSSRRVTRSRATVLRPTMLRHLTQHSTDSSTSHDSVFSNQPLSCGSPQTDTSTMMDTRQITSRSRIRTPRRLAAHLATTSSSPLSSPPPDLFDPYENATSTDNSSHEESDYSDASESNSTQQSLDLFSSQASSSNLRNMKGRDLFDCNIWADPLKTSVFYRFATSLRQRVKDVEPTVTHRFIAQMRDVGKLARVYTQNIDEIEKKIGLSTDLKHGFGNKKRKPVKQQPAESSEKEEVAHPLDDVSAAGTTGGVQTSQKLEDVAPSKPCPNLSPDKGVECVFLHGSLHSLRCFVCGKLCDWDEDDRESRTLSGEQPECPHCAGATAARQEKGKRALGIGKLRPDIVLYGEEHPQSDLISPIVQHDLAAGPDLLLVLGTSLRVHGLKVMVKEFAKAVHKKGGKVVFINFTKPSESVWGDVLDYWIDWDCDAWVEDLKTRKPLLWLTAHERLEMDRQRRETLAEKKREALKRRESINEKKRDSLGDKRRLLLEQGKIRPPPKNPVAMRNDYQCGAYIVWDIFQTLAKIGDRPFDNLGYTPSTSSPDVTPLSKPTSDSNTDYPPKLDASSQGSLHPPRRKRKSLPRRTNSQVQGPHFQPRVDGSSFTPSEPLNPSNSASNTIVGTALKGLIPQQQATMASHADKPPPSKKRARKSAPATFGVNMNMDLKKNSGIDNKRHERHTGKDRYMQAVKELAKSRKTTTLVYSTGSERLSTTQGQSPLAYEPHDSGIGLGQTNINESSRRHSTSSFSFRPCVLPPPDPPGPQYSASTHRPLSVQATGSSFSREPVKLPPFRNNWDRHNDWEQHVDWQRLPPLTEIVPMEIAPLVRPASSLTETRPGLSKSHYSYTWHHSTQPIYNDPLVGISRQATTHKAQWHVESNDDNTPSPSDQLRMEAANQLWQLRGGA